MLAGGSGEDHIRINSMRKANRYEQALDGENLG